MGYHQYLLQGCAKIGPKNGSHEKEWGFGDSLRPASPGRIQISWL